MLIKRLTYMATLVALASSLNAQTPDTMATHNTGGDTTILITGDTRLTIPDSAFSGKIYAVDTLAWKPIPAKATMMSAVLPGLGQAYNRKYWKIPLAWALVGGSTYFLIRYQNRFQMYRRAYIDFKDGNPFSNSHDKLHIPPTYDTEKYLTTYKDAFRKYRDYAIIAVVISYLMNVVDANVDAHLFDYNMSDDLSLHTSPQFFQDDLLKSPKIGVTLSLSFNCK